MGKNLGNKYRKQQITQKIIVLCLLLSTIPVTVFAVDTPQGTSAPPDAGAMLGQLEPKRQITPIPHKPNLKVTTTKVQQEALENYKKVKIDKVVYKCPEFDANALLQPLIEDRLHKRMSFDDITNLSNFSMQELRERGYAVNFVYPPAQEVNNKTLELNVVIGKYADIKLNNTSSLKDERILAYTKNLRPGKLINTNKLEKVLLLLNDIPGVEAKAALEPGKKPGSSNLVVNVRDLEKQGGYIYADDYGNRSTGRFRYGIDYHFNNVSHRGDQVDLSYLTTGKDLNNYLLRYSIPVGNDGAIARTVFSHMNYQLGYKYDFLHGDGLANTLELGVSVPFYRTQNHSVFGDFAYRHRALSDGLFDGQLSAQKSSDSFQLETHGYERGKKDSLTYSLSHTIGHLSLDNTFAQEQDTVLDSADWYNKSNALVYYIHQFDNRWQVHVSLNGQLGWKNLDSSEDFYIGGAEGVRAFPQGETGGDSGMLGTLEVRYATGIPGLQLTAFIDGGRVYYNRNDDLIEGSNVRNLAGAGLGLIYSKYRDWYAKFDWATPWGNHYSKLQNEKVHNTYWFKLVKQF